ncbi:MAG TPA: carboxypeptidase-like regulatory domain-containing protein [Bryobacteraceae bacterium]|nr:carboxypeptidase-like regulatory domain-containing protein [Bryobacteraceae bacterium]
MSRLQRGAVFVFLIALAGAGSGFAQSTTSLRGTLTDSQGLVLPTAVLTLTNIETAATRRVLSDAAGAYTFLQIPPGTYRLSAEKPGFATAIRDNIQLLVNTPTTLNLQLDIGGTAETVNVYSEASTINTVDASVGNPLDERQVRQLPLQTRNVVELLSLQPGVTSNGEVMGARRDQNNITLDGADVNNNQNSGLVAQNTSTTSGGFQGSNANNSNVNSGFTAVLPIPLDSVQEFRVTVAGEGPNVGRSSGGQVALVTKSGSNQLHGSLYEFNRNTLTVANTWFNNQSGVPRQPLVRNQFGGSLGGKIVRDRVFYFLNYEERTDASGVSTLRGVPSNTLRQGMLSVQLADGSVQTLTPDQVRQVDPLHLGVNPAMMKVLNQFPVGNDPALGADGGLNFSGFRFNSPSHRNDRAIVGKIDIHLDSAAKHTLSIRGTLADNTDDVILAEFPGQPPASTLRDNSKGISAQYTWIMKSNLINVFNLGFTRFGQAMSGSTGPVMFITNSSISPLQNPSARPFGQKLPTLNPTDDLTWIHGRHSITFGFNGRFIHNDTSSFANSFARYGYGESELIGLGADIDNDLTAFLQQRIGNAALADPTSAANGFAALFGMVNDDFHTDMFGKNGNPLPQGTAQVRSFIEHDYALYVGDTYRATRELTLTFGLRWEDFRPPYEANGYQIDPTVGLNQYFAERNFLQSQGVPQNAMPDAILKWALIGPGNGKQTWWAPDNHNFAPRVGIAYAPVDRGGILGKLFGQHGAFRAGAGIAYDRFGSDLIAQYDQFGSIGLANAGNFSDSYNFTTSPRYNGAPPVLPAPAQETFPYAPPKIAAIVGDFLGISPDLKPPYSYLLNASFEREIPGKMTIAVGYAGRLSHRLLMEGDVYTPLENFKDPKSGITWTQNADQVRGIYNALLAKDGNPTAVIQDVTAHPNLIPNLPFVQDIWPGLKGVDIPASASANYFMCVYNDYGGSYLDCLHAVDRNQTSGYVNGKCLSVYGCYTFFPEQGSSMPTWMSVGRAVYHGLTLSLRRAYANGLSFDFNYTWSHSIDLGSAAESGAGKQGAAIQNIYDLNEFRGSSDFDMRHNISADFLFELPFGKGKHLLNGIPGWANQIIGGWQLSSVIRYHTGLPTTVGGNLAYNANYWLNSLAIPIAPVTSGSVHIDQNGLPSIFANTSASSLFADELPGHSGARAPIRLPAFFNTDLTLAKTFRLPWEKQRVQFRAEAFNAFNNVNFYNPSLALSTPLTFGEFQSVSDPRTMQFALRYEF